MSNRYEDDVVSLASYARNPLTVNEASWIGTAKADLMAIARKETPAAPAGGRCPLCGHTLPPDPFPRCPYCGQSLTAAPGTAAPKKGKPHGKTSKR
jgi:hypothetical protein